jgi:hypothetical protein
MHVYNYVNEHIYKCAFVGSLRKYLMHDMEHTKFATVLGNSDVGSSFEPLKLRLILTAHVLEMSFSILSHLCLVLPSGGFS